MQNITPIGQKKAGQSIRKQERNCPLKAAVISFYSDIPAGTIGVVAKEWENASGKWYRLYLGKNLSGKKLYKHFHHSVIRLL
jgi:hypothetical protein